MRALVCEQFGPPEQLVLTEMDAPEPGPRQIAIDVAAAGLNFPDVLVVAGQYQIKTQPPFVPGSEVAGVVAAVGDDVKHFKVGDKVIAMTMLGAFAERCVVAESQVMPLLPGLSFAQGAGFAVTYGTAYHALKQSAALAAGETLLVLGAAGGVGIAAVELGKAMGATVIAAASSDAKLEFARDIGADHSINYSTTSLRDELRSMTDGKGVDVVFDPVGGDLAIAALRSLAWHGRFLVIGFASGDIPQLPANLALLKEAAVQGVWWGTWATRHPKLQQENVQEMAALIASGKLIPRVTREYALADWIPAFADITDRKALGKVVLVP